MGKANKSLVLSQATTVCIFLYNYQVHDWKYGTKFAKKLEKLTVLQQNKKLRFLDMKLEGWVSKHVYLSPLSVKFPVCNGLQYFCKSQKIFKVFSKKHQIQGFFLKNFKIKDI